MNATARHRGLAGLVAATALLLGACSPALPSPVPAPVPAAAQPDLTADQLDAVVERIGAGLTKADSALAPSALDGLLTGPAKTVRTAEYQVAAATSPDALTILPSALQSQFVPTTQDWPRVAMAVTVQPQNLEAQRLLVLDQESARQNYALWAWVRLFPGVSVPTFPAADVGTTTVSGSAGLSAQVPDVAAAYADYLTHGKKSAHRKEFAKDALVTSVMDRRATMTKALKAIKGSYRYTVSVPKHEGTQTLRTLDGGAVAVTRLRAVERAEGPKGSKVAPDAEVKGLLGKAKTSNALVVRRTVVVAFYVPAKGSTARVTVLGAENVPTGATIP